MKVTRPILFGFLALLMTGAAFAAPNAMNKMHNAMSSKSLNVNMGALSASKQTGTTTITAVGGGVQVKITLKNEPKDASEPAHIHAGTCAKINPAPWKPLSDVKNGTSTTVLKGVTIDQLKKSHYAVNVHKSTAELATYVSCGDV